MTHLLTMQRVRLTVQGTESPARVRSVVGALTAIRGVSEVHVEATGTVCLVHESGAVTVDQLRRALSVVGCSLQALTLEERWEAAPHPTLRPRMQVAALVVNPSSTQGRAAT